MSTNVDRNERSRKRSANADASRAAEFAIRRMTNHAKTHQGVDARGSEHWFSVVQYVFWLYFQFGKAHPTNEQMAAHAGCDVRTVQRIMSLAEQSGVFTCLRRGTRIRRNGEVRCLANRWKPTSTRELMLVGLIKPAAVADRQSEVLHPRSDVRAEIAEFVDVLMGDTSVTPDLRPDTAPPVDGGAEIESSTFESQARSVYDVRALLEERRRRRE